MAPNAALLQTDDAAFMAEQAAAAEPFLIIWVADNVGLTLHPTLISSAMILCRFLRNHCCEYVFPTPLSRQGGPPRRCSPLEMAYTAPSGTSYIGSATCRPHQVPRFCVSNQAPSRQRLWQAG